MIRYPIPLDGTISSEIMLQSLQASLKYYETANAKIKATSEFTTMVNAMRDMIIFLQHNQG